MPKTLSLDIPEKMTPLWLDPVRHNSFRGGRGGGKSWGIAEYCIVRGYQTPTRFFCGRETQTSMKDSVHKLLEDTINRKELDTFYTVTTSGIHAPNGTSFAFDGLRDQDVTKIKSLEGVDVAWLEEAQALSEKSLRTFTPTIRKPGSILIYSFNPQLPDDPIYQRMVEKPGRHTRDIVVNWRDNPWFTDELNDERLNDYERDTTPTKWMYNHIWEGHCLPAVEGAIFANEIDTLYNEKRVRPLDYDSSGQLHGIMDLGWGVQTIVLAQRFASTVQIIGYHEWRNKTYAEITADLREWYPRVNWGSIWMPHDAAHRDPKYGKSHKDVMTELSWNVQDIPQVGVENYIQLGREMFKNLYVSDNESCDVLLQCLRRFKYKITTDGNRKTGVDKDDYSHGGEAFCYTAVVAPELTNRSQSSGDIYAGFDTYAG